MPAQIVFHGINEFDQGLDRTVYQVNTSSREAVIEAGRIVIEAMRVAAPKKSGALAASIAMSQPRAVGTSGWTVTVGPTAAYGRRMELGYHRRHQYAKPGFRAAAPELPAVFAAHWAEAIR